MAYIQRFWLHRRDRYDVVTQNQNNCAETHLGGRDMNAFVSPLATIAWALSSTSGGSTALGKGTRRFWPHGRDRCRSLTLTCRNSPCWLSCECCNNVLSSFWSPLLTIDWAWLPHGMCVNWNVLQYLACATVSRNRGCNAASLWMVLFLRAL